MGLEAGGVSYLTNSTRGIPMNDPQNHLAPCTFCGGTGMRSTLIPESTDPDYDEASEHMPDSELMEVARFTGLRVRDVGELDYRIARTILETLRQ